MASRKASKDYVTKKDLEYIAKLFSKNFKEEFQMQIDDLGILGKEDILPRLEVIINFLIEIKTDLNLIKRTLYAIAKEELSYEEMRDLAIIARDIEKESEPKKIQN